ncbi:MAG: hypothetical protein F2793_02645 [Actinobacteria bacterium]|uniref:Unannotated protein n=1 Tax=freshwater metagenome TaxID=449393 RepID=A0A6J7DBH0_9ZZZZ|nr:hypothetical protein [Actinomycetota bacterium]
MIRLILAAPELSDEADLVAAGPLHGVAVSRRSLDAADLLAAAAADTGVAVVVSAGVPRLSGDLIGRVMADDRAVVGLAVCDDDERRLRAWGLQVVVRHGGDGVATMAAVADELRIRESPRERAGAGGRRTDVDPDEVDEGARDAQPTAGRLICVWGPTGAPGRTTTALALAEALASRGLRTCVIDGDTYAPGMVAQLGLEVDSSGLVVACRQADNGTLNARTLMAATRLLADRLFILGGLPRADRWPDLRESALRGLWRTARDTFDAVVVDVGPHVEQEGLVAHHGGSTLLASRRNAVAVTAIEEADQIVVATRASTLGLVRLLNELPVVTSMNEGASVIVAVTGAPNRHTSAAATERLLRQAGVRMPVARLARDPGGLEESIRRGATAFESASRRERRAVGELAALVAPEGGQVGVRMGVRAGVRAGGPRGLRRRADGLRA